MVVCFLQTVHLQGDFTTVINKLMQPQNIQTLVNGINSIYDSDKAMADNSKEQTQCLHEINESLKTITQKLEIIQNCMMYIPDGEGYKEVEKQFEKKQDKIEKKRVKKRRRKD